VLVFDRPPPPEPPVEPAIVGFPPLPPPEAVIESAEFINSKELRVPSKLVAIAAPVPPAPTITV
jgi:hypothetical protein